MTPLKLDSEYSQEKWSREEKVPDWSCHTFNTNNGIL
jgi:hypothetical protein